MNRFGSKLKIGFQKRIKSVRARSEQVWWVGYQWSEFGNEHVMSSLGLVMN